MIDAGMSGPEIVAKTGMQPYSLESRFYKLAVKTGNVSFCIEMPITVEYKAQRKSRGINISKGLCDVEGIAENQKFDIKFKDSKNGKIITLTPIK